MIEKTEMIDESCGELERRERERVGVRSAVMNSLNMCTTHFLPKSPIKRVSELGYILRYGLAIGFMTRKGTAMIDINKLAGEWIEAIAKMCMSHDKDGYDAGDAQADKLLSPLLAAPIKQVREFYNILLERMKSDKRIPFIVWISYEAWGEAIVKNAPDEGVKRLKRKLAADITDLAEEAVTEQLPKAMMRALMWRDAEQLEAIKEKLESGAKPKIRGRQSCLFLEAGRGAKKVSVMI